VGEAGSGGLAAGAAFVTNISGGTEQRTEERFCYNCGSPNPAEYLFCVNCGRRIDFLRPLPEPVRPPSPYPVRFDVEYPERLSRLKTLVRLILAIPHLLIIYVLGVLVGIITLVAWFAILFTRRYPKGLFNIVVGFNRWSANVYAYIALLRDEYPPFSTDPGRYAVLYEVDYPEKLSRWLIFFKFFPLPVLLILHQFVLGFVFLVALLFDFIAWFAILFTGRFPRGLFNFVTGSMRWWYRVGAYGALLRDEFPPYSTSADARPGSGRAAVISAVVGAVIFAGYIGSFIAFSTIEADTRTVGVSYSQVLAGRAAPPVDVDGNEVTLLRAEDPATLGQTRIPRAGSRYVRFQLEITNIDSLFTSVALRTFRLEDARGGDHNAVAVQGVPSEYSLAQGESVRVSAVFEVQQGVQPASLTYSPGFAAFLPFGERVRFEFR
jgi:hypothetical protein